tara:strand:- start:4563 stop:5135 length:573 start_codon:yes stop_codon:yes gene_type:complete
MKKLLFIIFLFNSSQLFSQTYLKVNGTYALIGVPSIGIEFPISKKFSFQLDASMSFWNSLTLNSKKINNRPFVFNQIFPEIRYYFNEVNDGFYLGAHIGYGMFKLSKSSSYALSNRYQYGYIIFTGLTTGYQWKFKEKWLLDIFLGGGWSKATYEGFDRVSGIRYDIDSNVNFSAQSLPYRGGIMIGYRF